MIRIRLKPLWLVAAWVASFTSFTVVAQPETFTPNDIADIRSGAYALTGATVHVEPGDVRENSTVLLKDGVIESVGRTSQVPEGYVEVDLQGRHVYPGFVDLYSHYGLPEPEPAAPFSFSQAEVIEPSTTGATNANEAIRAQYDAAEHFSADEESAAKLRAAGFSTVLSHRPDGIARGSAVLVSTGSGTANELLLMPSVASVHSFDKGSSKQSYPISTMGSVALLRQTYLDSQWYAAQASKPFADQSLEAFAAEDGKLRIFAADDWMDVIRADSIGDEFGVSYLVRSGGDEYQRAKSIADRDVALIVPLDFPDAPAVSDPFEAREVSLVELKHWEMAPGNPATMAANGVEFALTADGAGDKFWANLRSAIKAGLDADVALAALTTVPARLAGQQARLGRVAPGHLANLLVTSGPIFDKESQIEDHWVQGQRFVINDHTVDIEGQYELAYGDDNHSVIVRGAGKAQKATRLASDGEESPVELSLDGDLIGLSFQIDDSSPIRFSGWTAIDGWTGRGQTATGEWVDWTLTRTGDAPTPEDDSDDGSDSNGDSSTMDGDDDSVVGDVWFPFAPYGTTDRVAQTDVVFRDATVWTLAGDEPVLETTDVRLAEGKIVAIGKDLNAGGAMEVDAQGMHLTPGIVDEHSHIALSAVNDVAVNSAMVRMADVVDSEDVNIYRNLAGGVTSAQLLHGSANPIGGQSALVKLRWGDTPANMLIEGADGFIKFALGENVKRSRNPNSIRYPGTRMGVEQVFRDAFSRARDYEAAHARWNDMSRRERGNSTPPRRDLVMEAMVEVINSERFVTAHSYVQSEINMLMNVAEDYDFRINTFTHILEGYKVADKMAEHGAGGSTFADWWAYKWEVRYAIPYNVALMHEAGVTVAVNSDSQEMSRRLNQEAAKAVKYGGLSEVEALKTVTLNPAKLLHLDDRMGTIEVGKDADVVLWTDHPLSVYAIADQTWVDGRRLYDRGEDLRRRDQVAAERARLIAKAATAESSGKGGSGSATPQRFECDSFTGYEYLGEVR